MTTELTLPQRAAVALGTAEHEIKLRELVKASARIIEVKNLAGRDEAHGAMMQLKNARVSIEKAGKAAREDATAFSKAVIAEEKRLIGITEAEENRLQAIRDKWDADREAERQAKIEAERQRVTAIMERIREFTVVMLNSVGKNSIYIQNEIHGLEAVVIDSSFAEYASDASAAKEGALAKMYDALQVSLASEAEAARLIAEREELARLRREAEARRAEDERQRQEAEHKAAQERAEQQASIARQQAELEAQRKADLAALEEQRRQAEHEAAEQRAKQEAELAEQRAEAARQQAERDAEAAVQAQAAKEAQEAAQAALNAERAELQRQRDELEAARRLAEETEAERTRLQQAADQALADAKAEPKPAPAWPFPPATAEPPTTKPSDEAIIEALADRFAEDEAVVVQWLLAMDLEAAGNRFAAVA